MAALADPKNQKRIVIAVVAIIVIIFIWIKWASIKGFFAKERANADVKKDADDIETSARMKGETESFSTAQYSSYARQLEELMAKSTSTQERKQIVNIITLMNNNVDWAMLVKAFGVRAFKKGGILTSSKTHDLIGWLNVELNRSEIDAVNSYFNETGITARI